tara:strand:+ start:6693 stop:6890 length:198 start_codon:yes stop_codon:yes gene_type:complete
MKKKRNKMKSYRNIQNKLHKLKSEIMEIEESIKRAEQNNKPYFANRLRLMIEKKIEKINFLLDQS